MDKKSSFMDKRAIYGKKVLLLGFNGKFGSPHGKNKNQPEHPEQGVAARVHGTVTVRHARRGGE